jgi:hypothetical protein
VRPLRFIFEGVVATINRNQSIGYTAIRTRHVTGLDLRIDTPKMLTATVGFALLPVEARTRPTGDIDPVGVS